MIIVLIPDISSSPVQELELSATDVILLLAQEAVAAKMWREEAFEMTGERLTHFLMSARIPKGTAST